MFIKSKAGESVEGGAMEIFWGQAPGSISKAVDGAVAAARKKLPGRTLEWLELAEVRGGFEGDVLQYQVAVRIGYC
ncbi:dodecin domain-containing protein [Trinickia sp. LjRoot230]|uniref:dodecin domain-containing protein n=1 Tax=Trinickia sp. LjRoot230 TaxID=3342288 RepID=UPI003ED0E117